MLQEICILGIRRANQLKYHIPKNNPIFLQLIISRMRKMINLLILDPPILLRRRHRITRLARKQRRPLKHMLDITLPHRQKLTENTANCPDIDGAVVVLLLEDEFGGAVPAGCDVVGEVVGGGGFLGG
jgi:hypothetical protein